MKEDMDRQVAGPNGYCPNIKKQVTRVYSLRRRRVAAVAR